MVAMTRVEEETAEKILLLLATTLLLTCLLSKKRKQKLRYEYLEELSVKCCSRMRYLKTCLLCMQTNKKEHFI